MQNKTNHIKIDSKTKSIFVKEQKTQRYFFNNKTENKHFKHSLGTVTILSAYL